MAPISTAPRAQAPTGLIGSWVMWGFVALLIAFGLTACGGGGGAATPETPSVTPVATTLTLVSAKVELAPNGANVVVYTALGNKGADGGNTDITATTTWVPNLTGQALKAGATLSVASNGHLQEVVSGVATDLVVTPGGTVNVGGTATYAGKTVSVKPEIFTGGCEVGLVVTGSKCASKAFSAVVVHSTPNNMTQLKFGRGSTVTNFIFDGENSRPSNIRSCLISQQTGKVVGGALVACNSLADANAFVQYEITPNGYIRPVLPADEAPPTSFDLSHDSTRWARCPAFGEYWFLIPRTTWCTNGSEIDYGDGIREPIYGFRTAMGF